MRKTNVAADPSSTFTDFYVSSKDACLRAMLASGADRAAAEDAVAEAFARAWSSWKSVSEHPAPTAWVMRVALNHHVSRWRRRSREVAYERHHEQRAAPEVPSAVVQDEVLVRALSALPARQREVVALRVFLDLDTTQTGEVLGIAPGTVTAHLHRAMTALRAATTSATENRI